MPMPMRTRLLLLFTAALLMGGIAMAQKPPTPMGAFINTGSGWSPWSAGAGFGDLVRTPEPIALYCQAAPGDPWTPCQPGGGGGSGTVTYVGMTVPSVFSVAGSPITNAGTLAITFASGQTANEFLATPNGSSGAVGLRTIVGGDFSGLTGCGTATYVFTPAGSDCVAPGGGGTTTNTLTGNNSGTVGAYTNRSTASLSTTGFYDSVTATPAAQSFTTTISSDIYFAVIITFAPNGAYARGQPIVF